MIMSQLIDILQDNLIEYGDNEVIIIKKAKACNVTYLGCADLDGNDLTTYFFLSCEAKMPDDEPGNEFMAPKTPVCLRVVK